MARIYEDRFTERKGSHSYDVYVYADKSMVRIDTYHVIASNRNQAARLLEKEGFEIYSVNMTG